MNCIKLLFIVLLLPCLSQAQAIKEGKVKIGRKRAWAFTATYQHPKDRTIDAIEAYLADAKLVRTSKKKGYCVYKGAVWQTISSSVADYYYKAKNKRGETVVTFAVGKPGGGYVATTSDPQTAANVVVWLQNVEKEIITGKIERSTPNHAGGATLSQDPVNDPQKVENKKLQMLNNIKQHPDLPVK